MKPWPAASILTTAISRLPAGDVVGTLSQQEFVEPLPW
jgi:hypothetical protein